jgi:hypothetical protein
MADEAPTAGAPVPAPTAAAAVAPPGRTASEFSAIADALRSRVDLFGKTLAAVATLGTTAVGLSKIGDLFPADGNEFWAVVACVSLVAAALAAIAIAVRLMKVGRPVFMRADLAHAGGEIDDDERRAVLPVFEEAAKRFGYSSLGALQVRERSLRNAAARTPDPVERARRLALADEVKAAIDQALAQGQVVAVRCRATKAVSGTAWWWYLTVIAGLIAFAAATDAISSARSDPTAEAKACGEARTAGATAAELGRTNDVCEGTAATPAEAVPPSVAEARAQITSQLAAALEACSALIHDPADEDSGPLQDEDCDPVRKAVASADPAGP